MRLIFLRRLEPAGLCEDRFQVCRQLPPRFSHTHSIPPMFRICHYSPLLPPYKVLLPWACCVYLLPANSSTFAPLSPLPRSSRTTSWMMREPMKA